jgi:hypothetical protein
LRSVFAWPLVLAAITAAGLVSALLGDGVWDVISWLLLISPLAIALWYGWRSWRARPATRSPKKRLSSEPTSQARL